MSEPQHDDRVRWLDRGQQGTWRALIVGTTLLFDKLDHDLQKDHDLSLSEFEILVRLSERDDKRMRMAVLADSLRHSRSRVTHTVTRMEADGLVRRQTSSADGRGVEAVLTDAGRRRLEQAAATHVRGVREYLVDAVDPDDLAAMGRVFDAVSDSLVAAHPAADIRSPG